MTIKLRPYQEDCIQTIHDLYSQGKNRQIVSLPTGAGKTVVFSNLIKKIGCRTLVLAHTNELLEQAKEKIQMICPGLDVGIVNSQSKQFEDSVVISSTQAASVPSTLDRLTEQDFGLVIADEAHHFAASSTRKILSRLGLGVGTTKLLVGFTATAFRADGKGLGEVFDVISYEKNIKEMIDDGYLCRPKGLKIATDIDFSKIKTADGDFQAASLITVMDTPELNQLVVEAYQKNASGMSTICFGVSVQHAINLSEAFTSLGIPSKAIYGDMPQQERSAILNEYREGSITVLCNCQILTEGFDAPQTSCVIVAKPTKSLGLYQQMVGRGLRLWPNKKECIVIDCNDSGHSICNAAMLLKDTEEVAAETEKEIYEEKKEVIEKLPTNLNQKLKSALINFDPLGESFTWTREGYGYILKGVGKIRLQVVLEDADKYDVIFSNENGSQVIGRGLNFEYAFATSEDFANANKSLFVISEKDAPWRKLPISERQAALIISFGYKSGIHKLSRGQASAIISSGILNRKSRQIAV